MESAAEGDTLALLITPVKKQLKAPMLVLEGGFLMSFSLESYHEILYIT